MVAQLVSKFPTLYGFRMFITMFTGPNPEPDESSPAASCCCCCCCCCCCWLLFCQD